MINIRVKNRQSMRSRRIEFGANSLKIEQFWQIRMTAVYLFVNPAFAFYYLGDKFVIIAQSFYNCRNLTGTRFVRIDKWS